MKPCPTKYRPKTIEDCVFHLTEQADFDEIIIWANALDVEVNYPPTSEMYPDWEVELRQEVEEALLKVIEPPPDDKRKEQNNASNNV